MSKPGFRRRVISFQDLPCRLPIVQTAVVWLILDRVRWPVAVETVIWTLWAIAALSLVVGFFQQREVRVLPPEPGTP